MPLSQGDRQGRPYHIRSKETVSHCKGDPCGYAVALVK